MSDLTAPVRRIDGCGSVLRAGRVGSRFRGNDDFKPVLYRAFSWSTPLQ